MYFDDDEDFLGIKILFLLHDENILGTNFFITGVCSFFQVNNNFIPRRVPTQRKICAEKILARKTVSHQEDTHHK